MLEASLPLKFFSKAVIVYHSGKCILNSLFLAGACLKKEHLQVVLAM